MCSKYVFELYIQWNYLIYEKRAACKCSVVVKQHKILHKHCVKRCMKYCVKRCVKTLTIFRPGLAELFLGSLLNYYKKLRAEIQHTSALFYS